VTKLLQHIRNRLCLASFDLFAFEYEDVLQRKFSVACLTVVLINEGKCRMQISVEIQLHKCKYQKWLELQYKTAELCEKEHDVFMHSEIT
jgi:hypothetical protein